ncbi:CobW family GTP-binding protein [Thalassiella azotivora]
MPRTMPVTILSTTDPVLRDGTAFSVLADAPDTVSVRHDLSTSEGAGTLRRVVSDARGVIEDVTLPLEHSCLSCALREDVLPTLVRLADDGRWSHALLALPVGSEPLPVVRGLSGGDVAGRPVRDAVRLAGSVCVLDGDTLEHDLLDDDLLVERGLEHGPDDRRAVGEALAHQLELAHLVLVDGTDGRSVPARPAALLAHLVAPETTVRPGPHEVPGAAVLADRHEPGSWHRVDPLRVEPTAAPDTDGVWTLDLSTWRPLHPGRLLDRIEDLGAGRLRARGRFWLPTRPEDVAVWDGAGGQLSIGGAGPWRGHDRSTRLVVTGVDRRTRQRVAAAFEDVVLRDDELARGRAFWMSQEDGFDDWLGTTSDAA